MPMKREVYGKSIISVYAQTFPKRKKNGCKDEDEVAIINKVVIERGGTLPSERLFDHHPCMLT